MRNTIKVPKARGRSRQRGYEILEFALMAALLVPAFLWTFINGMNMIRLIQCNQICRDIGNLYMQGVDFTTYQAQSWRRRWRRVTGCRSDRPTPATTPPTTPMAATDGSSCRK